MNQITLSELSAAWLSAKADEDAAKARRLEIEAAIVAAMPGADEGTVSEKTETLKVSVTRNFTRSADVDALMQAWTSLQPTVQKAFSWKADVSVSVSVLRKLDAQEIEQASRFITTKPAKASVKVEVL
ncbi:MAG: hypothetical protein JNK52_16530 [Zoogloeaceae bacterium]|nr:hypothetical protein [Zoogloeaceae bacterium]